MIWLIAKRLVHAVVTLWMASVLYFVVIEFAPGDFAVMTAGQSTTDAMMEETRKRLGLDAEAVVRYVRWLWRAMQGDLGLSWWAGRPIFDVIGDRLAHSVFLMSCAAVVTVPLGVALAIVSIQSAGHWIDRLGAAMTVGIMSMPEFLVAYGVMFVFAVQLEWFPAVTLFALDLPFWERLFACVLPVLSLVFVTATPLFRNTKAALSRTLNSDYVEMAVLKGLSRRRILWRHVLPNAIGPIANSVVMCFAHLFFGLVIIEIIYSYPGFGSLIVQAVRVHDMPLALGCALVAAAIVTALNALADIAALLANPKLREARG